MNLFFFFVLYSTLNVASSFSILKGSSPRLTTNVVNLSKGFGSKEPEKKIEKSEAQLKREAESKRYDEIAKSGGQEYNVFVRQFGSSDKSWLPCGAISVPRGAQVADAIYANVDALKTSITRMYPKLKGFEGEFEFGSNLRVYPDDPIEVAVKRAPKSQGLSLGNWISSLLSPIDASNMPPPKI
jgi:Family of unknown function (DUF6523)